MLGFLKSGENQIGKKKQQKKKALCFPASQKSHLKDHLNN